MVITDMKFAEQLYYVFVSRKNNIQNNIRTGLLDGPYNLLKAKDRKLRWENFLYIKDKNDIKIFQSI